MYKIAVIGDRDSVLAFKALGLDVYFAQTAEEAQNAANEAAQMQAQALQQASAEMLMTT